jgi:hypothetical protein
MIVKYIMETSFKGNQIMTYEMSNEGYDDPNYLKAKDEFEQQLEARCACYDQGGMWPNDWDELFAWCDQNGLNCVNIEGETLPANIWKYKIPDDLSKVVFWACEVNPRLAFGDPQMALLAKLQLSAVPWDEYNPACREGAASSPPFGKWTRD